MTWQPFRRRLTCQRLEQRCLLSGDGLTCAPAESPAESEAPVHAWHHATQPADVDRDGQIASSDLAAVLGLLITGAAPAEGEPGDVYYDVDNDGLATPNDLVIVLNHIIRSTETQSPWHNLSRPADVDADGMITGTDVSLVRQLLDSGISGEGPPSIYYDVNNDHLLSDADLDLVMAEFEAEGMDPAWIATPAEVTQLLARAAAASASDDAIIAVVDRQGVILGVHVEDGVDSNITGDLTNLVFAVDGAAAKARTGAFFSSNSAPLTSRTVRFISQSTITQREVESNPNISDPESTIRGPGFVAPIGLGGHFPPEIPFTPQVDLFGIEHQSRDSRLLPGADYVKQPDGPQLENRFNVDDEFIPTGAELAFPESYGFQSGQLITAQARGIATLPGGLPLYKEGELVGGIGVFFPGEHGFATHEQNFVPASMLGGVPQSEAERTNAPLVLESEWIALAATGGSQGAGAAVGEYCGLAPVAGYDLPFGRIDLVGITLEAVGPHPTRQNPVSGPQRILQVGNQVGRDCSAGGVDLPVNPEGDLAIAGHPAPAGWLVEPHDSTVDAITAEDVREMIEAGINEANLTRAAIRLPLGTRTRMVFAVADTSGEVLGLFRMPDATIFSIDVSVAKARNTAYYADAAAVLDADLVDDNLDGIADIDQGFVGTPSRGAALSNRTFRFLSEPRFPTGAEGVQAGAFSILTDPGINPLTAENLGDPLPFSVYDRAESIAQGDGSFQRATSVYGWDAFHPMTNFRDLGPGADARRNQNGIVFFPGSSPLYVGGSLVGGFGVSGDGVDQDDVVTSGGLVGFGAPTSLQADQFFVRNIRIPYLKFNRNPRG